MCRLADRTSSAGSPSAPARRRTGPRAQAPTADETWASDVTVISNCDIFINGTGIAVAEYAVQAIVVANGIDRNNNQGITVYDGDTHQIMGNCLHTNSQAETETYAHIDVGANVSQVGIANNTFGPLDGGYTNLPDYCVNVESGAATGCILGNIGVVGRLRVHVGWPDQPDHDRRAPVPDLVEHGRDHPRQLR